MLFCWGGDRHHFIRLGVNGEGIEARRDGELVGPSGCLGGGRWSGRWGDEGFEEAEGFVGEEGAAEAAGGEGEADEGEHVAGGEGVDFGEGLAFEVLAEHGGGGLGDDAAAGFEAD